MQNISGIGYGILFALCILIVGSIFSGLYFKDILIGIGSTFFGNSIYVSNKNLLVDFEYISWYIKILPLLGTIGGLLLAIFLNKIFFFSFNHNKDKNYVSLKKPMLMLLLLLTRIKSILNNKIYLDFVINNYFGVFILKHSYETFYKTIDKGVLEIFMVNGLSFSFMKMSRKYCNFQNGYIFSILCSVIVAIIFSVLIYFLV